MFTTIWTAEKIEYLRQLPSSKIFTDEDIAKYKMKKLK